MTTSTAPADHILTEREFEASDIAALREEIEYADEAARTAHSDRTQFGI